jgi:hypothetical protein
VRAPPPGRSGASGWNPWIGRDASALRANLVSFLLAGVIGVLGGLAALAFEHLTELVRIALVGGNEHEGLLQGGGRRPRWQGRLVPAGGGPAAPIKDTHH